MLLGLLGPGSLWLIQHHLIRLRPVVATPTAVLSGLGFGGVALFALGWLLVGASLWRWRGGSSVVGGLVAAGVYWLTGLVWVSAFNLSLGIPATRLLHPTILLFAFLWPLQVAQALGFFGLSFQ